MKLLTTLLLGTMIAFAPAVASAQAPGAPHDDAPTARERKPGKIKAKLKRKAMKMKLRKRLAARFDADGDGRLSPDERKALRKAVKKIMKQRRQARRAARQPE
jgi:hypothetical protein